MDFLSIQHILVHIPLGKGGYDLSWIEAVGSLAGILCIWAASKEKIINYPLGLINVTLFAIIFFQIQLYSSLLLQVFFFAANIYGWYAWSRTTEDKHAVLQVRWLTRGQAAVWLAISVVAILLLTFYIDNFFALLTKAAVNLLNLFGLAVAMPHLAPDAYPFWDACITVLSVIAMVLMTRKHTENWLLWLLVNVISVVIFTLQGVYVMSLEYVLLTFIALNGLREWQRKAQSQQAS